jgi:hypothetical protein
LLARFGGANKASRHGGSPQYGSLTEHYILHSQQVGRLDFKDGGELGDDLQPIPSPPFLALTVVALAGGPLSILFGRRPVQGQLGCSQSPDQIKYRRQIPID